MKIETDAPFFTQAETEATVTLVDVLEGASPGPWLLSGEQYLSQVEGEPSLPWHVPGNWPFAVIHQYDPNTYHLGRGDGFQIAGGVQELANARLVRAAREMAEAIAVALALLDPLPSSLTGILQHMHAARARLKQAEAAITAPIPMAKPVQR